MMSDGLLHYSQVDIPMGEFWLNSPTHDKPNDMLDAISAAHIYGKKNHTGRSVHHVAYELVGTSGYAQSFGRQKFCIGHE